MTNESLNNTQGNYVPSQWVLNWAFHDWAKANEIAWDKMSVYEKVLMCSQVAAEKMFGTNAEVHTDGVNYFSIRVNDANREVDSLYFGQMGAIPDYFMKGSSIVHLKPSYQQNLLEIADNMNKVLGELIQVDAREVATPDGHSTLQQLFITNDAASIMAIAAYSLQYESACDYDFFAKGLWSLYTTVCQAMSKTPRAYVSLLGPGASYVPTSELQNPVFNNPYDLEWWNTYDLYDIAIMPISNLTLKYVDEDVAAGLLLADLMKTYWREARACQLPTSAYLRTATLLKDYGDEISQRIACQTGSKERLSSMLVQEMEEFLKEA